MAYRTVRESSLTAVADAIRAKKGTAETLTFPDGFVQAVEDIKQGSDLPAVEQATPSISVSSGGLITATTKQEAGVVEAGTKSATKQLTTQAAKTVTPGTSNQTAVASGRYTTGAVTVKGDSNLVAGNIKKGVSIFNVTGTLETDSAPVLQEKTVTPTTSQQTVSPDSGYDGLSKVTVNAMPTATQATPSITVSTAGKITASATQTAGYVAAGTKSATKQMTVQEAQTITPGTSNQTISSGRYLTGTQTIKGDANLVAGNIKSGVSIFGVAGSYEGSGGVDTSDATATADDMAVGKTAYVNGEKITGELTVGNFLNNNCNLSLSGSLLNMWVKSTERQIVDNGSTIDLYCSTSKLGDATAADVAAGKTFTSANGLKITGTASAGGGLPSGISALASGSYTHSDSSAAYSEITHDLGVAPNFLVWFATTDTSSGVLTTAATSGATIIKDSKYTEASTIIYNVLYFVGGYNSSGQHNIASSRVSNNNYMTTTKCRMTASSTYPIKTGLTYKWVCGVLDV